MRVIVLVVFAPHDGATGCRLARFHEGDKWFALAIGLMK
jgi:hypothetical protein